MDDKNNDSPSSSDTSNDSINVRVSENANDSPNSASSHHESHYPVDSSFDKMSDIRPPEKATDDDQPAEKPEDSQEEPDNNDTNSGDQDDHRENDHDDDRRPSQPFFKHEAEPRPTPVEEQPTAPVWQDYQQPLSVTPVPQRSGLFGYKLGLGLIVLAIVGLVVFVVMQAGPAKQDRQTSQKANHIADQLNAYTDKESKVPENLGEAGITDVPSAISYKKLSDETYKFCVTYQSAGSDYGSSVFEDVVYSGMTGMPTTTTGDDYYSGEQHSLYLNPEHKKGENCQTIEPYLYGNDYLDPSTDYTDGTTADPKEEAKKAGAKTDACGVSGFAAHYSAEVVSVTPSGADYVVKVKDAEGTLTGEQTFTITKGGFNIYDRQCTASNATSLFAGDKIAVFTGNSDKYAVNAIVNYYQ